MSTTEELLTTVAENMQSVYEAGKASGSGGDDAFWDAIQDYGNRTSYIYAFSRTNFKTFKAKYGFDNVQCNNMFNACKSEEIEINSNTIISPTYMFGGCENLLRVKGHIGVASGEVGYMFYNSKALKCIDSLDFTNISSKNSIYAFHNTSALEEVRFIGTIPCDMKFSYSNLLSYESLMSIINALKDYSEDTSGTTYTLTLGTTNLAKLSNAEKAIATEKGWTLA